LITGIGQGFMLTSPLQLAYAVSIIANHGRRMVPHVVGEIEDPVARVASEIGFYERPAIEITNGRYWDDVINGMLEVVHGKRGTARRSGAGAFYRYAGKTGTAQLFGIAQDASVKNDETPKLLRDHALFIAFAPEKKPEIAVAIIVENGGSGTAAPIARQILDYYLLSSAPVSDNDG
jgi:penicillin-binding protein 2